MYFSCPPTSTSTLVTGNFLGEGSINGVMIEYQSLTGSNVNLFEFHIHLAIT